MPLGWLFVHVNKDGSLWLYSADILGEELGFSQAAKYFDLYSIPKTLKQRVDAY